MKIKKGDNIYVIAGKDKGKTGVVTSVLPEKNKIVATGLNIAKKHLKPSQKSPHGGILDMPKPFAVSNALVMCPHCSLPSRVAYKITDKTKERICRKCKSNLDVKEKNVKA